MAWLDIFQSLKQNSNAFDSRLLRGTLPLVAGGEPLCPSVIERASAVLASHLPNLLARRSKSRLVFLLPNATQSLGRFLAVSLLLADVVQRLSKQSAVLQGDLLLVTQHIRSCLTLLRTVGVRYHSQQLRITEFRPIEVLSQYAPGPDAKSRVFIANPGWSSVFGQQGEFGSVVVDASHPRTADHLESVLKQPSVAAAPLQILVLPPWEQERINALAEPDRPSDLIWAWDPAAVEAIEELLGQKSIRPTQNAGGRVVWLCDDPEVEDHLVEIHSLLVGAMKAANGNVPGPVLGAWGTYHKLRQLAVPLIALEEERKDAYQTLTIQDRIESLEDEDPTARGALGAYLDAHWPRIISELKALYGTLLRQKEPAKFFALANVIEEFIRTREALDTLRLVAPSTHEGNMLTGLLSNIIDGWADALQSGAISLTTVKEEPREIAEGMVRQSVLLGFRTSQTRYLDVYPGVPVHLVAYPYEAEIDEKVQQRIHASIESFQENEPRSIVLEELRLTPTEAATTKHASNGIPKSKRPITSHRFQIQKRPQQRHFLDDDGVEPLSFQSIIGQNWFEEIAATATRTQNPSNQLPIKYCDITDVKGDTYRFPMGRLVDVFHPATEQLERISVESLRPGISMVVLVDDPYEEVFHRLLEAIREQRDMAARLSMAIWDSAKPAALTKFGGNRMKLHRALVANGLSVDYGAVVGWYRTGEDEILAPADRDNFEILARASGLFNDPSRIADTFNCIERERVVRRTSGRTLRKLLSQLASGKHYDVALECANAIGTPVEAVAAAIDIREIESIRPAESVFKVRKESV